MYTKLQEEITAWHTKRFPDAQSYHVAIKAMEELGEVASEVNGDLDPIRGRGGKTPEEAADVVICLMVLLGRWYPDRDLLVEVQKKLDVLTDPNSGHRSAALPVENPYYVEIPAEGLYEPIPELAKCSPCSGSGTVSVPFTHPTNPNLDTWNTELCGICSGKGVLSSKTISKDVRCRCGDFCFGNYTQCGGSSGCFNCPA